MGYELAVMADGTEQLPAGGRRHVELQLPAEAEYLRLARYAAADAATRAGLSIDDTDDVRLAVSELCTLLAGADTPIRLCFEAETDPGAVVVTGSGAPGPELEGENGELAQMLIGAVVDDFRFQVVDGQASFRIRKQGSS